MTVINPIESSHNVEREVNRILIELFDLESDRLSPDKRLVEDLGLDSLDAVDLALRFQRQFKVDASQTELQAIRTLGDVYLLIEKSLKNSADQALIPDADGDSQRIQ